MDVGRNKLELIINSINAILKFDTFMESARFIFDQARSLTGAKSGYVALLSKNGKQNEVLFLESGGVKCTVNQNLPMPIRGLREQAYEEKKSVFNNNFMKSDWIKFLPKGHMAMKNVLFAPLIIDNEAVGVIGLANKESDFTDEDAYFSSIMGKIASIALYNNNNIEKLNNTLHKLEKSNKEIKNLQSLLPICANCKKIRNDEEGYWEQVEKYISDHTSTIFTHSICPDCIKKLYPEINLKDKD